MADAPSIKRNYAYNMAYQVLALLVPFVTVPYISRVLGAAGVGTYSFTFSLVTYFMLVAALGVQGYGSREMSRNRDNRMLYSKLFWEITVLIALTTLVCLAVWIALSLQLEELTAYMVAFAPMLVSVAFDISWFYIGLEKMGHVVLRNTAVKISGLVLMFLLVRTADDLIPYILVNSGVQLAGNVSMWVTLPGLVERPRVGGMTLGRHFSQTLIYFVPALATSLYTVLNKTLIGVITGDPFQNGYYEQADRVVRMAMALTFASVNVVVGARLSYLFEKGNLVEARARALRSLDYILLLAYAFAFGIAAAAESFVPIFFGEGYEPVILLLRMTCPLVVIISVSNCAGSLYYIPSGRRAQSARYILVGAALNILVSISTIPVFGMYGAVAASLAAESIITLLYVVRCGGFLSFRDVWRFSRKRLVAGVLAVVVALGCSSIGLVDPLGLFVSQAFSFVVVYAFSLAIMKDSMLSDLFDMGRAFVSKAIGRTKHG